MPIHKPKVELRAVGLPGVGGGCSSSGPWQVWTPLSSYCFTRANQSIQLVTASVGRWAKFLLRKALLMADFDFRGARGSGQGDDFHELWALRHALELLLSDCPYVAMTVEGLRPEDELGIHEHSCG